MIILLPPSETKTAPTDGSALSLENLSFPALSPVRTQVAEALTGLGADDEALAVLGISATLRGEAENNQVLFTAPAAPAINVYTGVLYSAVDALTLSARGKERLQDVYVSSALFGIVRATDLIPAYRLSMKTKLPPLGAMSTWWRKQLGSVLDEAFADELIVDCRSGDYRKSWPGPPQQVVTIDVAQIVNGQRKVVSHNAKHTRGEVVRHLLETNADTPATVEDLAAEVRKQFPDVEITRASAKAPAKLTVILPEQNR